ncbi:hypothetical protein BH10PSE7_BH10PSE7_06180 [soil metagenome]
MPPNQMTTVFNPVLLPTAGKTILAAAHPYEFGQIQVHTGANTTPAEAEDRYYAMLEEPAMAT